MRPPAAARLGLLLPAVAVWPLAAVLTLLPAAALPTGLTAAAVGFGAVRRALGAAPVHRRRLLVLAVGALACAAVSASVALQEPARHPAGIAMGHVIEVRMRVDSVTATAGGERSGRLATRVLVRGRLVAVGRGAGRRALSAPARMFAERLPLAARQRGALLGFSASLRSADPGDDAGVVVSAQGPVRAVDRPRGAEQVAGALRSRLAAASAPLGGDGAALLPGLAIGDTTAVPDPLAAAMKASSLSHLTAVSGANCAIVTVAVFALAGLVRLPRGARVTVSIAALAGFVVLVTPQPSVLRSAVMSLVALLCIGTGRTTRGTPLLALSAIGLLIADPWMARNLGFALSVLATGGLLLLAGPITARLEPMTTRPVALLVAVPLAAQLACQPLLVLLQPSIPLLGVPANLLAAPAAPLVTVLGLLACLLLPVAPLLGHGLLLLAWLPATWIAAVARCFAGATVVPWILGPAGAVLAALLLTCSVVALHRGVHRRLRLACGGLLAAGLVALLVVVAGAAAGRLLGTPRDWEVAACDVGQGDGLVLNGGDGHVVVVDTGREPPPIQGCLDRLGVRSIDLLVLTHWDVDHVGAARSIAARVRTAFVGPSDGAPADALRADLVRAGARVQQVRRGDRATVGRLAIEVIWPPEPLGGIEPGNAASVTLVVRGRITTLLTGDLGEEAQDALLAAGPVPPVDVVKVAHHGSADQSPALYRAVAARVGLVSVGADNDYGHPTRRLLRILAAEGTQAVRTDQDGLVLVTRRGRDLAVWTERPVTARVWDPAK